jgi:hypothetical protein
MADWLTIQNRPVWNAPDYTSQIAVSREHSAASPRRRQERRRKGGGLRSSSVLPRPMILETYVFDVLAARAPEMMISSAAAFPSVRSWL